MERRHLVLLLFLPEEPGAHTPYMSMDDLERPGSGL